MPVSRVAMIIIVTTFGMTNINDNIVEMGHIDDVVVHADVWEKGQWEPHCQNGGGSQQHVLPIAFKLQVHEERGHQAPANYIDYVSHVVRLPRCVETDTEKYQLPKNQRQQDSTLQNVTINATSDKNNGSVYRHNYAEFLNQRQACI